MSLSCFIFEPVYRLTFEPVYHFTSENPQAALTIAEQGPGSPDRHVYRVGKIVGTGVPHQAGHPRQAADGGSICALEGTTLMGATSEPASRNQSPNHPPSRVACS